MAFQNTQNTFNQGMNKDSDHRVQANSTYKDAKNITVMGKGDFYAAKNLAGSKELKEIIPSTSGFSHSNVLGAFECNGTYYSYSSVEEKNPSLIIFTSTILDGSNDLVDTILLYDLKKDVLHTLLQTTPSSVGTIGEALSLPEEGTIDAVIFGEKSFDRIYFDDHKNPLRDFNITDNPISNARGLTTSPLAPVDEIKYLRQEAGSGQLSSGTYQIAYRYYGTDSKKYSAWSLLTLGIPVFPLDFEEVDTLDQVYGGVPNEFTKKSIVVEVEKSAEYSVNFDSIQLAVIKNTGGLKIPSPIAYLTSVSKEWFNNPSNIVYDGQGLETTVDAQEIVTEDAAIENAKTLTAKDNVLFRGNVKYLDRDVDDITFDSAETISKKIGTAGTRYNTTSSNSNNPVFNQILGEAEGQKKIDETGAEVSTNYAIAYLAGLNVREGSGFLGADAILGRMAGSLVEGDTDADNINLTIPENILPGNEIFLKISSNEFGMREWPSISPGNDEWGFHISALIDMTDNLLDKAGLFAILLGSPTVALAVGGEDDSNQLDTVPSFKYIVKAGDTAESVAKDIQEQLSLAIATDPNVRMFREGSTLSFRVENITQNGGFGINKSYKPTMFIEWGMSNGVNLAVADNEGEVDDLINNPDSIFGGYKNPKNVHSYKGYFRDEVYRFGLVYMDKFGNWSRPVPFDFSANTARSEISPLETYIVSNLTYDELPASGNTLNGTTRIQISDTIVGSLINKGDLVKVQTGVDKFEFAEVRTASVDGTVSNDFTVGGIIAIDPGFTPIVTRLKGGENSWVDKGTDWKFPKRKNYKFPMMCSIAPDGTWDGDNTYLNPIGLRISGITNHPDWAVSLAVVRVRRLKNIVWQSPAITTQAIMPSLLGDDVYPECTTPVAGSSPVGTYGPKSFSKGVAAHIERLSPDLSEPVLGANVSRPLEDESNIPKLIVVVPPEYMYQLDGSNFGTGLTSSGANLEIVDAVTFFRTGAFDVDGSGADDGDNPGDQLAFGIRADNAYNYYYKDTTGGLDINTYPYKSGAENSYAQNQIPESGTTKALFYGENVNLGAPVALPAPPSDYDFKLKSIITYGALEAASSYNCSNEVTLQKSIVVLTELNFGDFSYLCRQNTAGSFYEVNGGFVGRPDFSFWRDPQRAGGDYPGSERFNVGASAFYIGGTNGKTSTGGDHVITGSDGACSAAPIVNLVRGIDDDRYGKEEEVHQYIHTGAYAKLSSTDEVVDIDVWGGDCFISKHAAKISDTHLDLTKEGVDGDETTRLYAYNDFQEVLMVYLESTVNCEMQSGQFHYPVIQRQSLQVFAPSYDYPYNPGYSVENELKVWVSKSNIEESRLKYPSRIIYSDQKIFQTDVEGFDRFRAFSFYDLPEDHGGITKLTKLPNDNVYVIQESAVAVLPINKNIIEDSTGGQLVVNSSTLINTPTYILNQNGSQHIRSVINSDTSIFFMDAAKREVFKIGGGEGSDGKISENGMHSEFLDRLMSKCGIPDMEVVSGYDLNNNEYWIGVNGYTDKEFQDGTGVDVLKEPFHYIWSDKLGAWMTEISLSQATTAKKVIYSGSLYYLIGIDSDNELSIESLYEGDIYGRILKSSNESSIKFVINPEEPFGKTFDVLRIDSSNRCDRAIALIHREEPLPPLQTAIDLNRRPRHDSYEVPMLLAQNKQRVRGKACELELFIANDNTTEVKLLNVMTKYRLSSRTFK